MIPRQLFFIWFGDEVPKFAYFSLNAFKEFNTNFSIDLIHYTIDDVINCQDSVLNYCKNLIFNVNRGIKCKYYDFIKLRLNSKFNFIQILTDIIRFEILYYYGGIYLDCDTFPTKQFDDKLLNNNSFSQNVLCFRNKKYNPTNLSDDPIEAYDLNYMESPKNYNIFEYTDIYFIGAVKNYRDTDIKFTTNAITSNPLRPSWIRNIENTKYFIDLKEKFYNCDLKIYSDYIFYNHYISHFCNKSWQKDYKSSKIYCEYDDYIYRK